MRHLKARPRAFAATDLVISLGAVCICISVLLPAIQEAREAARNENCNSRLIGISVDAMLHQQVEGRLPSMLGSPGAVPWEEFLNSSNPSYWGYQQYSSPLAQGARASGRLEMLTGQSEPIDLRFWDFDNSLEPAQLNSLQGYAQLSSTKAPIFLCPSNQQFQPRSSFVVGAQPGWLKENTADEDYFFLTPNFSGTRNEAATNYLGCMGACAGASNRVDELAAFRGMITSRENQTFDDVSNADGLSATIMYGETVGEQRRDFDTCVRYLSSVQTWVTSSVARGRGSTPWMESVSSEATKDFPMGGDPISGPLGRLGFSSVVGFGSSHPKGVNFVFGDGHVEQVSRSIDLLTLYAAFGAFDSASPDF